MNGCVYRTEAGYCQKYTDSKHTSWCVDGPCGDAVPSNGDVIRSMTDGELAEFLGRYFDCGECKKLHGEKMCKEKDCIQAWLAWVQSEAQI